MKNILAIGYGVRNIVEQGRQAGYNMYAIDRFCDFDLEKYAVQCLKFDEPEINKEWIIKMIEQFNVPFDAIILGSGFENMDFTQLTIPILNNEYEVLSKASDKKLLSKKLQALNMPHPRTLSGNDVEFANYPLMAKPKKGGGGTFNRIINTKEEMQTVLKNLKKNLDCLTLDDLLLQEFIDGESVSVSLLSTKNKVIAVSVNEQLIGIDWLTNIRDLPFAYCGNITPFKTKYEKKLGEISKELILELGLIGSNGVDFIISDEGPVIIEVNPRMQGTMDTIELALGINMFEANLNALNGILPDKLPIAEKYAARTILYAENDLVINKHIFNELIKKPCKDVPNIGCKINRNSPITSIISTGKKRDSMIEEIKNIVKDIKEIL